MDYGSSDTSTTSLGTNQFPISETWTPNAGFSAVEGGPQSTDLGGKKSAPASMYVKDGSDVAQGQTTDAAVTGDTSGTLSAKLRGLLKIWTDVWDSVNHRIKVDGSGVTQPVSGTFFQATQPVSAAALPLPTGAALEAGHLATIDTSTAKIPSQGQALAAASLPVVLPALQQTALTPPAAITGFALEAGHIATIDTSTAASKTDLDTIVTNTNKIPASPAQEGGNLATLAGIVTASKAATKAASGDFADGAVVGIGTTTQTKATDGTITSWSVIQLLKGIFDKLLNTLAVTQSGTWTVQPGNTANTTAWKVDGSAVTQPVSGTVTANAGTNLNTSLLALESGGHLANIDTHTPALGSAVSASSSPVVIASDQAAVASKRSTVAVYSLASTVTSGTTQNSGDLTVGPYTEISIDINTTAQAGTSPTIQLFYERKGADGIYYVLWQSAVLTAAANTLSTSIGSGMAYNQSLGATGRLRWVVGGSATPTYTFSANIQGK